jgi:hypothetical protein
MFETHTTLLRLQILYSTSFFQLNIFSQSQTKTNNYKT